MINAIGDVLEQVLRYFMSVTGSAGVAIILLTLAIKLVLHPLTRRQLRSMKQMQVLTPQINALRAKYKDNPQQMNSEVMSLYRANGVNPLSGCLPMLVQLPVLWGLFAVLRRVEIFHGATFLGFSLEATPWAHGLAGLMSNPLLLIWPLLVAVSGYFQQRISITDPQQARMFLFMPLMFGIFAVNFPIGLSVYWTTTTLAYILEYYIVVGRPAQAKALAPSLPAVTPDGETPAKALVASKKPILSQRPKGAKKR
ncbi:MAG TPA: YidC/Oxa1 family membrane protein insertase [bacterium]